MKKISMLVSEFVNVVSNLKCCQFVSVCYTTDAEHVNAKLAGGKKNPYHGRLTTITECSGLQFNANYENGVNNRLPNGDGKGERFVAEPLPWGEWLIPNKLIGHKGATYIRLYKTKNTSTTIRYYLDGALVEDAREIDLIKSAFRPQSESKRQSEAGIAVENQMKPFNLNVKDIRRASMDGVNYTIVSL